MRYHLIMDADDTLWENNIYFEQAIHAFVTFLDHSRLSREEVRAVLDEVERLMGYGSVNFTKSLVETYRRLAEKDLQEQVPDEAQQVVYNIKQVSDRLGLRPHVIRKAYEQLEERGALHIDAKSFPTKRKQQLPLPLDTETTDNSGNER